MISGNITCGICIGRCYSCVPGARRYLLNPGKEAISLTWGCMTEVERINKLRHDISNPLSALLAETQLLLLNESQLDAETVASLREIEALAVRMRTILREN